MKKKVFFLRGMFALLLMLAGAQSVSATTVYYVNTNSWSAVNCYYYNSSTASVGWPGDAMTKTSEQYKGYDVYSYDLPDDAKNCIFSNNGSSQTADLASPTDSKNTYYNGSWIDRDALPTVTLNGSFNNWGTGLTMTASDDKTTCSTTLNLTGGTTTEFRIVDNGSWLGNSGTMTRDNCTGWTFDANTNCKITADYTGDYTFTYTYDTNKLSVTYPDIPTDPTVVLTTNLTNVVVGTPITLTATTGNFDDEPTITYYNGETALSGNVFTSTEAGTYTLTAKAVGNVSGESQTVTSNAVTVTVTEIPDLYLRGVGGDWTTSDENKFVRDGENEKWTLTMAYNTTDWQYGFKIADANWGNCNFGSDGKTPLQSDVTYILNSTDSNPDHLWFADGTAEGDYTFTLTKDGGTWSLLVTPAWSVTYSIAGSSTDLFGGSVTWDATNTATDMTENADGTYSWTKNDFTVAAGTTYKFKVVVDHAWGTSYGDDSAADGNAWIYISEEGTYNITITFDPTAKAITKTITANYIKHPWDGTNWTWKALTKDTDGTYYVNASYGGNGCNYNTSTNTDDGSSWVASPTLVGEPATGNYCKFSLNTTDGTITITKLDEAGSYTRSNLSDGKIGTICLPYAVNTADFTGAAFYSVAGYRGTEDAPTSIVLSEVYSLSAGVPYIFIASAESLTANYSGNKVDAAGNANGLYGSFDGQDVAEGMYLISGNKLVKCGTGCSIAANRAYIDMTAVPAYTESSDAKVVELGFDGETDGISTVNANANANANSYNIAGQRVNANAKGIIIKNGKKFIVK